MEKASGGEAVDAGALERGYGRSRNSIKSATVLRPSSLEFRISWSSGISRDRSQVTGLIKGKIIMETNCKISVAGVGDNSRAKTIADIEQLVNISEKLAYRLSQPFKLAEIIVTDRFQEAVNQLELETGPSGEYSSIRSDVRAVGTTRKVVLPGGDAQFVVIIDASQMDACDSTSPRFVATLYHELVHVRFNSSRVAHEREDETVINPWSREAWLNGCAKTVLDEYDVDRQVDVFLRSVCKKSDGSDWTLRELEEAYQMDWVGGLVNGLDRMPSVIDTKIYAYQTGHIAIDDLAEYVIPYVKDLLTLMSHTIAIYDRSDQWPAILDLIRSTEGGRRFLRQNLDIIINQLSNRECSVSDAKTAIATAVENIFVHCGLGFQTVDEGVYISVQAPAK